MGEIKMAQGSPEKYAALETKDEETVYWLDDGTLFRGTTEYGGSSSKMAAIAKSISDDATETITTSFNVELGRISSRVTDVITTIGENETKVDNKFSTIEQTAEHIQSVVGEIQTTIDNQSEQITELDDARSQLEQTSSSISAQVTELQTTASNLTSRMNNIKEPVNIVIASSNGTQFRDGNISTVLSAIVYKNSELMEADDETITYQWYAQDDATTILSTTSSYEVNISGVNFSKVFCCKVDVVETTESSSVVATDMDTITLRDLTDLRAVSLELKSNKALVQTCSNNNGTYSNFSPDYTTSTLIITPQIFFGNTEGTINKDSSYNLITYYVNNSKVTGTTSSSSYYVSGGKLYIHKNLSSSTSKYTINAIVSSLQDPTYSTLNYSNYEAFATIDFSLLTNGEDSLFPYINYERAIFTDEEANKITLTAELYKGGSLITSGVTYQWACTDSTVTLSSATESTLSVTRDMVNSVNNFICTMSYLSNSYEAKAAIQDKVDPVYVDILSSAGETLSVEENETTLTCRIFKDNSIEDEDPTGTLYNYTWQDETNNAGTSLGTGKTLTLTREQVQSKIIVECTIEKIEAGATT